MGKFVPKLSSGVLSSTDVTNPSTDRGLPGTGGLEGGSVLSRYSPTLVIEDSIKLLSLLNSIECSTAWNGSGDFVTGCSRSAWKDICIFSLSCCCGGWSSAAEGGTLPWSWSITSESCRGADDPGTKTSSACKMVFYQIYDP